MFTPPQLIEPAGDPELLRAAARQLRTSASDLTGTGRRLQGAHAQVAAAWEGRAQQLFELVAGGMGEVVHGASSIAAEFSEALLRYAAALEAAQAEVRQCQRRLNAIAAATAPGTIPDMTAVRAAVSQADMARTAALRAAQELERGALHLIGQGSGSAPEVHSSESSASFVSRVHGISGPAAAATAAQVFDAQAADLERGVRAVVAALAGPSLLAGSGLYPTTLVLGGDVSGGFSLPGGEQAVVGGAPSGRAAPEMLPFDPVVSGGGGSAVPTGSLAGVLSQTAVGNPTWDHAFGGFAIAGIQRNPSYAAQAEAIEAAARAGHPGALAAMQMHQAGVEYQTRNILLPAGYELVPATRHA